MDCRCLAHGLGRKCYGRPLHEILSEDPGYCRWMLQKAEDTIRSGSCQSYVSRSCNPSATDHCMHPSAIDLEVWFKSSSCLDEARYSLFVFLLPQSAGQHLAVSQLYSMNCLNSPLWSCPLPSWLTHSLTPHAHSLSLSLSLAPFSSSLSSTLTNSLTLTLILSLTCVKEDDAPPGLLENAAWLTLHAPLLKAHTVEVMLPAETTKPN